MVFVFCESEAVVVFWQAVFAAEVSSAEFAGKGYQFIFSTYVAASGGHGTIVYTWRVVIHKPNPLGGGILVGVKTDVLLSII
jgi:hypothetical protein